MVWKWTVKDVEKDKLWMVSGGDTLAYFSRDEKFGTRYVQVVKEGRL